MRLLFLNYEYPPLGGGAANASRYLLKEWAQLKRFELVLICSSSDRASAEQVSASIRIERLDIGKHGGLHYQTQKDLLRYAWAAYQRARELHQRDPFDGCLAFFGIPCGVVARALGLPYLVSLRGSDVPFYNPRFALLDRLIFQRLSRKVWRDARAVLANSEGLRTLAHQTAPDQAIAVIPNGVDTSRFSPAASRPERLEILTVARLIPRKGLSSLIEAMPLLPESARLSIAGDGTQRAELEALARRLGVSERVRFLGALPHASLPEIYRASSVFVLPSQNEGMSNTVLEAMASGMPVVLTDTGGTKELLDDGKNGFRIAMNAPDSIAAALRRYLDDPSLIETHGTASRKRAEARSWSATALAYAEQFERCFGKGR